MSAAEKIPWQELTFDAADCADLWLMSPEHFLATVACKPGFPERRTMKPAGWRAGDVIAYLNANPVGRLVRRRSRCSTAAAT